MEYYNEYNDEARYTRPYYYDKKGRKMNRAGQKYDHWDWLFNSSKNWHWVFKILGYIFFGTIFATWDIIVGLVKITFYIILIVTGFYFLFIPNRSYPNK